MRPERAETSFPMKDDLILWVAIVWFLCMCVAAAWVLVQPATQLGENQIGHTAAAVPNSSR
jgi:hypothetical protein